MLNSKGTNKIINHAYPLNKDNRDYTAVYRERRKVYNSYSYECK